MPEKKGFKQVTIKDFEAKREEREQKRRFDLIQSEVNKMTELISSQTDKAVVSLLHELGYTEAHEHMSMEEAEKIHAKLLEDGKFINISSDIEMAEDSDGSSKLVVTVSLVQEAKQLTFEVKPEE